MNPKIKELWASVLESGEYKQGKGRLKREEGYCCLGVLCDLYRKETGNGAWTDEMHFAIDSYSSKLFPPSEVLEWAGLTDKKTFIEANDLLDMSFIEIAALVRAGK